MPRYSNNMALSSLKLFTWWKYWYDPSYPGKNINSFLHTVCWKRVMWYLTQLCKILTYGQFTFLKPSHLFCSTFFLFYVHIHKSGYEFCISLGIIKQDINILNFLVLVGHSSRTIFCRQLFLCYEEWVFCITCKNLIFIRWCN